jgi:hypothetical protein
MNDDAFIVIDNSAKLVIDNPNQNAITIFNSARIISESEFDQIKWNIGTNTGNYLIPFFSGSSDFINFTCTVVNPGIGNGSIYFSTYGNTSWQNSTYLPSDVTHFNSALTLSDNSANATDRFWIIDATGYTTKPRVSLEFNFVINECIGSNTIDMSNLKAQRFNSDNQTWGDFAPAGTNLNLFGPVSNVNVSPADFYRSWTLVNPSNPMPVELLSFDHECIGGIAELKWTTASETNNMVFTLEKSDNGMVFEAVSTIAGAGNSNMPLDYSFKVETNKYYRLSQTDYNGITEEIGNLYANCMEENELVWWQSMERLNDVKLSGLEEGILEYQLYDMSGKLIMNENHSVSSSDFLIQLPELPNGMYTISLKNNNRVVAGKVMMVR